jgi:hypothetical protein
LVAGALALTAIGLFAAGCSGKDESAMASSNLDMSPELRVFATTMHFTAQDLEANRQGRLGDGQRPRFRWDLVYMGIGLVVALVAFAGSFIEPRGPRWYIGAIVVGGLGLGIAASQIGLARELYAGRVVAISGKKEKWYGSTPGIRFTLGGVNFFVPRNRAISLRDGQRYKVYYLPHSKAVVSVEPLESKY